MRKRWMAAAVGVALAGPAAAQNAGVGHTPQQTSQSQAEYERGIHHDPGRHDPAADAARRMESVEGHSHATQPAAPVRR